MSDLKLNPARLDALAVTARKAKATLSGRVDHTHSLRDHALAILRGEAVDDD